MAEVTFVGMPPADDGLGAQWTGNGWKLQISQDIKGRWSCEAIAGEFSLTLLTTNTDPQALVDDMSTKLTAMRNALEDMGL